MSIFTLSVSDCCLLFCNVLRFNFQHRLAKERNGKYNS